jgi:hypothetical protein
MPEFKAQLWGYVLFEEKNCIAEKEIKTVHCL